MHNRFLSVTETHVFGPRVVNEFRFGFLDLDAGPSIRTSSPLPVGNHAAQQQCHQWHLPFPTSGDWHWPKRQLEIPARGSTTSPGPIPVSYSLGKHFLRVGGLYTHTGSGSRFPAGFQRIARIQQLPGLSGWGSYYAFDASGVSKHRFLLNDTAAYFQDDYKLTQNLTVNLGVRWDLISAPKDALHHTANVIPDLLAQGESPFVYPKSVNG